MRNEDIYFVTKKKLNTSRNSSQNGRSTYRNVTLYFLFSSLISWKVQFSRNGFSAISWPRKTCGSQFSSSTPSSAMSWAVLRNSPIEWFSMVDDNEKLIDVGEKWLVDNDTEKKTVLEKMWLKNARGWFISFQDERGLRYFSTYNNRIFTIVDVSLWLKPSSVT